MTRKSNRKKPHHNEIDEKPGLNYKFDLLNSAQKMAWRLFQNHDVMFMTGVAGTGKTYLGMAFAIHELLNSSKDKIILTRPILESGEKLGFLPGDFEEKVHPYMVPLYDSIDGLCKGNQILKGKVNASIEIAPLAYLRGRTFSNAICIFDEAQNATYSQLKLFISRLGQNSKMIITNDPNQSDLVQYKDAPIKDFISKIEGIEGVAHIEFKSDFVVRHPLIAKILDKLN